MSTELTGEESKYLATLAEKRHAELLHELHHAATRAYKDGLKQEIELTERVKAKLERGK